MWRKLFGILSIKKGSFVRCTLVSSIYCFPKSQNNFLSIDFRFLKVSLKDINLVPEIGDILLFKNNFYEVDSRVENQLILGKDPDYAISTGTVDFGSSHSIILNTHLSRVEKLNLIPLRGGKYPSTNKITDGTANLLG